jgi:hypothetical protein
MALTMRPTGLSSSPVDKGPPRLDDLRRRQAAHQQCRGQPCNLPSTLPSQPMVKDKRWERSVSVVEDAGRNLVEHPRKADERDDGKNAYPFRKAHGLRLVSSGCRSPRDAKVSAL